MRQPPSPTNSPSPRLTIAIPTLNRARLVERSIQSSLAQTYSDLEIIVSNNGSTDSTRRVLDRYAGAPRLRIIHLEKTIPAPAHGNFLVDQARGEFFLGLSDDDWLEADLASRVIALYDRHPDVSFVWTGCLIHYADMAVPAHVGPELESGAQFLEGFLANRRNICWCACVTRTADLRRIGPIPPQIICGDMFYWTKLASDGPVGCVPEPISHYTCYRDGGDGSAGGTSILEWAAEVDGWVKDILETCREAGLKPEAERALRRKAAFFLACTTANQFIWLALRGKSRLSLLQSIPGACRYLRSRNPTPWIRVISPFLAPNWLLRNRFLAEMKRKAPAPVIPANTPPGSR